MKKLIMTTVAAFGFAALAQADVLNSTGFEEYGKNEFKVNATDTGATEGDQYWTGDGSADFTQTVLKTYGEDVVKPTNLPDDFETAGDYFLSVDTGNAVMYRRAAADPLNTLDLSDGPVFFDADVKFTASETAVVPSEGDKLLVWLKGDETTTNLVVTAGVYDKSTEMYVATAFTIDGDYSADTWYRLTVKATSVRSGDGTNNTTAFNVYVDGKLVTSGDTTEFYSLLGQLDTKCTTLEAAGFQGTGALDNVVWTTTDPFYVETEEFTVNVTLAQTIVTDGVVDMINGWTLNGEECSETTGARGTVVVGENAKIEVLLDIALPAKVTATVGDAVVADDAIVIEENNDGGYNITITIDGSSYKDGDEVAVAIALTETSGGEEVPTAGEAAAGGSATVKAESEEAALTAVTVKVDNAVAAVLTDEQQKAAFVASFFTKSVVDNKDGTYTVNVTVNGEAVEATLDDVVAEALETAADGEITTIPAGLCYKIESGNTVGLGTVAKGVSTGATIEVEGLSPEAGFYKVSLDVAPIK